MAVAHTFDVGGEVEADGSVANGVHGLGIKEVVRPRWRKIKTDPDKNKHGSASAFTGFKKNTPLCIRNVYVKHLNYAQEKNLK